MYYLSIHIILLWASKCMFVVGLVDLQNIRDDIRDLNLTCNLEICNDRRFDSLSTYDCHCGMHCIQFGTCCLDSKYVEVEQPKLKPTCLPVSEDASCYMIDRCPSADSKWNSLCTDKWEGDDDVLKLVPVTGLLTHLTYKNYFCFKCHESNDEFVYWTVELESQISQLDILSGKFTRPDGNLMSLTYARNSEIWMASFGNNSVPTPVKLSATVPSKIAKLVHFCETGIISKCSDAWSDQGVAEKCQKYMAIKEVRKENDTLKYRNAHCALCNFENLDSISCRPSAIPFGGVPFSFVHLLDINQSDGDAVGKAEKCKDEYIWDPYAKKCRILTCALPEYKIKNGKCVKE